MNGEHTRSVAGSGRGIRIAIVDSGVHAEHPHVQGIAGGVAIDANGAEHADYVDRLGHGTAVTAAIKEKAPDATLFAVKIFDSVLSTDADALVRAIEWAARSEIRLVNLSLGTARPDRELLLADAIALASSAGVIVVAAGPSDGVRWLPGSLPGVLAVGVDWSCPRDRFRAEMDDERVVFRTSGYPREIPGVPPERNLKGLSFAVANMTGFAARALEKMSGAAAVVDLIDVLATASVAS